MECTEKQYEDDLKDSLLALGYEEKDVSKWNNDNKFLVTNLWNIPANFGNLTGFHKTSYNRHFINHYNPELFLALAAMTEGEDWIVGEWLVLKGSERIFKCNDTLSANSSKGSAKNIHKDIYRKTTKKKLINHFTKQTTMEKNFILPKKWCVEVTNEILEDLITLRKTLGKDDFENIRNYTYCLNDGNYSGDHVVRGQLITTEQFKKYVLKQNNMEKKLLGYKLIKPEYRKAATAIINNNSFSTIPGIDIKVASTIESFKKAGVLDLWFTPVYEEIKQDKEFNIPCKYGSFNLTVKKEGFLYIPDNRVLNVPDIISFCDLRAKQISKYLFTNIVEKINMGCKKEIKVSDLDPLIEYWRTLQD